jgi:hypothetical protein
MVAYVVRHQRHAVAAQISRACADDTPHPPDRDCDERRILEPSDAYRNVDALLDKVYDARSTNSTSALTLGLRRRKSQRIGAR